MKKGIALFLFFIGLNGHASSQFHHCVEMEVQDVKTMEYRGNAVCDVSQTIGRPFQGDPAVWSCKFDNQREVNTFKFEAEQAGHELISTNGGGSFFLASYADVAFHSHRGLGKFLFENWNLPHVKGKNVTRFFYLERRPEATINSFSYTDNNNVIEIAMTYLDYERCL